MRIENISIIIIGVISLILSFYTFSRGKNKAASRLYSIIIFLAGPLWSLSIAMFRESQTVDQALFWDQMIYVVATFIPPLVFLFSRIFPKKKKIGLPLAFFLFSGVILNVVLLVHTNYFIQSVELTQTGNSMIPGQGYIFWLTWFCTLMPISIISMIIDYKKLTGPAKEQAKYIILGASFPILGTAPTNAIFPLFGIYQHIWVGPYFLMLMNITVAYGLTRTRFISRKSLTKGLLQNIIFGVLLYISFYVIAFINISYTGELFSGQSYLLGILITTFAAPLFLALAKAVEDWVSMLVLNQDSDPVKIRDDYTKAISSILNINEIATKYIDVVQKFFSIPSSSVVVINMESKRFVYRQEKNIEIPKVGELLILSKYFDMNKQEKIIILEEELFLLSEDSKNAITNSKEEVLSIMKKYDIKIIIPTAKRAQYFGLFLLGESKDKKIPKIDEIKLLETISNNTSVSIGRALLHNEVEAFNETLQGKVDKATTRMRDKNKQLQGLYDGLESLYQKEKDLMDMAGHEIRTPASIVKTNLHMLQKHLKAKHKKAVDKKTKTYMERLTDSTERQISIINSFLETARIDNDHFSLVKDTFDLTEITSESVTDIKNLAKDKKIKIDFEKPRKKIHGEVDRVRIREVMDNLLNNAVKYTSEGQIDIEIGEKGGNFRFEVRDTGMGIDPEDQKNLFQKFSRVGSNIGKEGDSLVKPGGTGLGLYVSKNIIEEHKGKIGVTSKKGQGSTFFFEIPLQ